MPVSFIIFKRAGAASWTSIRRYLSSRRRGGGSSYDIDNGGAGSNELKAGPESSTIDNGNPGRLPKLPRIHLGNWTGFRTLLSRRENNAGATTELRTYGELNSVDEDYHAQLKRAWGSPPPPSHPRTSDSVSVPGAAV
ncbi:hypothetical protein PFICI_14802 [Pestalotiopsis fici W106-1]|uniref:Uncharacterized protein n=1 Tax=Pestalotiopsis fici (strain W106-1 / CGMCC3.15140) TaxID=1229662 RepID=W3WM27_PESFW|nr:uncharacterized protein PFICI_14802 [Pestalotiopsis fici W106-1]ETS73856.1 hypothetical protein PFICI_14802 [Pestalotiopsis fici W106-1]